MTKHGVAKNGTASSRKTTYLLDDNPNYCSIKYGCSVPGSTLKTGYQKMDTIKRHKGKKDRNISKISKIGKSKDRNIDGSESPMDQDIKTQRDQCINTSEIRYKTHVCG